jgi:hypothetical protein
VPRLDADHRQVGRRQRIDQPLRQRPGLDPDPAVGRAERGQKGDDSVRLGQYFLLKDRRCSRGWSSWKPVAVTKAWSPLPSPKPGCPSPSSIRARCASSPGPIGRLAKTDAIGVGDVLARALIAELPELGRVDRHQIAALAGVAPMNRDSGRYRGKRKIQGGRVEVRAPLYMACLVAIQHNPALKVFYRRLRDAGKPARLALVATMRKLLTILNAMLRDRRPWAHAQS